ncbi:MAG: RICIN domain-containing protein [Christensenellaceae bacterium]|jgi:hypothetical protein|nr:RICIN domain-containing protein [Christensenellaceae bacterium]
MKKAILISLISCIGLIIGFVLDTGMKSENNYDTQYREASRKISFSGIQFDNDIEECDYLHMANEYLDEYEISKIRQWLEDMGFGMCEYEASWDCAECKYIRDNFNKILLKAIDSGVIKNFLDIKERTTSNSLSRAWWGGEGTNTGGTHVGIIKKAVEMLSSDKGTGPNTAYSFFNKYINSSTGQLITNQLLQWVIDPDEYEHQPQSHYYVVDTADKSTFGEYYRNRHWDVAYKPRWWPPITGWLNVNVSDGEYSPSPRTRLEDHYSAALNAYKSKRNVNDYEREQDAVKHLGWAIHYLQDMGNSFHGFGVLIDAIAMLQNKDPHNEWEKFCSGVQGINTSMGKKYRTFNNNFLSVNELAKYVTSSSFASNLLLPPYNSASDRNLAELSIGATVVYLAALLDQFYTDIKSWDNDNPTARMQSAIKDGQAYQFKNMNSQKYMDASGTANQSNVNQYPQTGLANQSFTAIYRSTANGGDGSFEFAPKHTTGQRLDLTAGSGHRLTVTAPTTSSTYKGQRFKVTYLQDGRYRIMSGDSGYSDVVQVNGASSNNNQAISSYAWNPDSLHHFWSIEPVLPQTIQPNKIYQIKNAGSGLYLEVGGCYTSNGSKVTQYNKSTSDHQRWKSVYNSDGTYSFVPLHSPTGHLESIGMNMKIYSNTNAPHDGQRFYIAYHATNRYKIVPKKGLSNGNTIIATDNTLIKEASYANSNAMHYWAFELV